MSDLQQTRVKSKAGRGLRGRGLSGSQLAVKDMAVAVGVCRGQRPASAENPSLVPGPHRQVSIMKPSQGRRLPGWANRDESRSPQSLTSRRHLIPDMCGVCEQSPSPPNLLRVYGEVSSLSEGAKGPGLSLLSSPTAPCPWHVRGRPAGALLGPSGSELLASPRPEPSLGAAAQKLERFGFFPWCGRTLSDQRTQVHTLWHFPSSDFLGLTSMFSPDPLRLSQFIIVKFLPSRIHTEFPFLNHAELQPTSSHMDAVHSFIHRLVPNTTLNGWDAPVKKRDKNPYPWRALTRKLHDGFYFDPRGGF